MHSSCLAGQNTEVQPLISQDKAKGVRTFERASDYSCSRWFVGRLPTLGTAVENLSHFRSKFSTAVPSSPPQFLLLKSQFTLHMLAFEGATMLIDFSFSNFRSFRKLQQFTMERAEGLWNADAPYSTVSAVYGGNAAGKSNFFAALTYVSRFVRKSFATAADEPGTGRSPYRLDSSSQSEPSLFALRFSTESAVEYKFEFSVDDKRVRHERLSRWDSSRPTKIFERSLDDSEKGFHVTYGKIFRGPRAIYEKALVENALLLSVMASAGNAIVAEAFDFLAYRIRAYDASGYLAEMDEIALAMRDDPAKAKAIQLLVRSTDLGISRIEIDAGMQEQLFDRLNAAENGEKLRDFYEALVNLTQDGLPDSDRSTMIEQLMQRNPFSDAPAPRIAFGHDGEGGAVLFKQQDESKGTIAALSFLSVALGNLSEQSLAVVDEIDSSLHPSVVRALVGLYNDPLTNPHGSQLVFTTHDVSLLMQAVDGEAAIAPDQFWIVEKRAGESELYPATDFGLTDDENMARNYLNGQYGGVLHPRLREAFAQALEIMEDSDGEGRRRVGSEE